MELTTPAGGGHGNATPVRSSDTAHSRAAELESEQPRLVRLLDSHPEFRALWQEHEVGAPTPG